MDLPVEDKGAQFSVKVIVESAVNLRYNSDVFLETVNKTDCVNLSRVEPSSMNT